MWLLKEVTKGAIKWIVLNVIQDWLDQMLVMMNEMKQWNIVVSFALNVKRCMKNIHKVVII